MHKSSLYFERYLIMCYFKLKRPYNYILKNTQYSFPLYNVTLFSITSLTILSSIRIKF